MWSHLHPSLACAPAAVDTTHSHKVSISEFRDLIMHMAAADLHSRRVEHAEAAQGSEEGREWVASSWEEDEEVQTRLRSWVDHIMQRRHK